MKLPPVTAVDWAWMDTSFLLWIEIEAAGNFTHPYSSTERTGWVEQWITPPSK